MWRAGSPEGKVSPKASDCLQRSVCISHRNHHGGTRNHSGWSSTAPPEKAICATRFLGSWCPAAPGGKECLCPAGAACSRTASSSGAVPLQWCDAGGSCRLCPPPGLVSARPAHCQGLKLKQAPLAPHPVGTWSSHQTVHLYCLVHFWDERCSSESYK